MEPLKIDRSAYSIRQKSSDKPVQLGAKIDDGSK